MFEFAISQQQRRPVSRWFFASWIASIMGHILVVILLIQFPQLLGRGLGNWIRNPFLFSVKTPSEPQWRTVTVLGGNKGPMAMPSTSTLKELAYDWQAHQGIQPSSPIRLRWSGEISDQGSDRPAPATKLTQGLEEPKPVPQPGVARSEEAMAETTTAAQEGSGTRTRTVALPAPEPPPEPKPATAKPAETAGMISPVGIPKELPPPNPPVQPKVTSSVQSKSPPAQIFENEQKAIKSEGTGFFDTKGFPLGDYASTIIERVKGKWFIPSNLKNHQGRTTVIFFIDKDGRCNDAHIVNASGNGSLDLAALNAIIGSNPFPPLPRGFPGERVGAKFVFAYNERQ
jgi:TonB family protein